MCYRNRPNTLASDRVEKAMQADGLEWGEGYRPLGRRALATP